MQNDITPQSLGDNETLVGAKFWVRGGEGGKGGERQSTTPGVRFDGRKVHARLGLELSLMHRTCPPLPSLHHQCAPCLLPLYIEVWGERLCPFLVHIIQHNLLVMIIHL
jgi:hypothetical protein